MKCRVAAVWWKNRQQNVHRTATAVGRQVCFGGVALAVAVAVAGGGGGGGGGIEIKLRLLSSVPLDAPGSML